MVQIYTKFYNVILNYQKWLKNWNLIVLKIVSGFTALVQQVPKTVWKFICNFTYLYTNFNVFVTFLKYQLFCLLFQDFCQAYSKAASRLNSPVSAKIQVHWSISSDLSDWTEVEYWTPDVWQKCTAIVVSKGNFN